MKKQSKTFDDLSKVWLPYHKRFIKESTYSNYINIIDNHLLRDFKDVKLFELSNNQIQDYVIHKCKQGSTKGNSLSVKTVKDIMVVLKLLLRYSFSIGYSNSFDLSVKYPKTTTNQKPMIIGKSDIQKIISFIYISDDRRDIGILFGLLTGMRIGEICALRYRDICVKTGYISVNRTLQRIYTKIDKTKIIESTPKTSSSIRKIPLSKELKSFLDIKNNDKDNFILSNTVNPIEPRLLRNRFNKVLRLNKLQHYKFHALRHTFATRCIEIKIDYKTISALLGHSTINTTLNLYVHPNNSQKKKAINKLTASLIY